MKVSEQRLDDVVSRLQEGHDVSSVSRDEWVSIARELKQLRLRTSSGSRTASAPDEVAPHGAHVSDVPGH